MSTPGQEQPYPAPDDAANVTDTEVNEALENDTLDESTFRDTTVHHDDGSPPADRDPRAESPD
jgi:hypothetical protein